MPADAVDPGIDEQRQHEAVEGSAQEHAGQERTKSSTPLIGRKDG
jgi:hypothetical protein